MASSNEETKIKEKKSRKTKTNSEPETETPEAQNDVESPKPAASEPEGSVERAPKWNMKFSSWNVNGIRAWAGVIIIKILLLNM